MEINELKTIVAQNIFYLRTINHMTQFELGEKLNYSDKAISKWERGDGIPDAFVLLKISELFGVNVDYILSEHKEQDKKIDTKPIRKTRRIISKIVNVSVFAIAVLIFVILALTKDVFCWKLFIYVIPAICIIDIVFSFVWEKGRFAFLFISLLVWSILFTIYFAIGDYSMWMIFLIGIPAQVIVFLCFRIKISIKISQKEHIKKKEQEKDQKPKTPDKCQENQ